MNRGWMQRRIAERASQLQVSYRRGPLGAGRRRRLPGCGPVTAFPIGCTRADGTTVRLYDALGPAWALLGPEPLAEVARERLGDVVALRGDGDAMLVRPDGHLAWRGTDAAGLRPWLDTCAGHARRSPDAVTDDDWRARKKAATKQRSRNTRCGCSSRRDTTQRRSRRSPRRQGCRT